LGLQDALREQLYYGVTLKSIPRMKKMLSAEWFHSKTVTTDDLYVMPDPKCFETCVIHAIARHACMSISPGPNIFNYRYLSETGNHVINMELTRIEQYWLVDSDAKRPGKFTKDMTSHSIRKLSKNILARQTKLPEQYAYL